MADGISITDLEQKTEVTDNDNFAVDNGVNTNKVTAKQIKDYMGKTYLSKAGGTMTGNLIIQNALQYFKRSNVSKGDIPTSDTYFVRIDGIDANNSPLFQEYNYITKTNGIISFIKRIWANKAGSNVYKDVIRATVTPEGNATLDLSQNNAVTVQTPAASDSSTKVATTAWVRNLLSSDTLIIPQYTTRVSIGGNTTFTAPSNGVIVTLATSGGDYVNCQIRANNSTGNLLYSHWSGDYNTHGQGICLPVRKGDTFWVNDYYDYEVYFYPAQ